MARPGLRNHPKFIRAVAILGMPAPHVYGHLEFLWSVAYESGDPVIGTKSDVEACAGWAGEPGKLFNALLRAGGPKRAGFIERASDGRYQIHQLFDHAPEYVRKRMEREEQRQAQGKSLSDVRREAAASRWNKQTDASENHLDTGGDANGSTPTPTPAPAPTPAPEVQKKENTSAPNPEIPSCPPLAGDSEADVEEDAEADRQTVEASARPHPTQPHPDEEIYQAYPRHVGKADALRAIRKARAVLSQRGEIDPHGFLLYRVKVYAESRKFAVTKDPASAQFTPHPATWFNKGHYDDEQAEWHSVKAPNRKTASVEKYCT